MDSARCSVKASLPQHAWPCARDARHAALPARGRTESNPELWRPWVRSARDVRLEANQRPPGSEGAQCSTRSKGAHGFQHPVRLYLPKSKSDEYLRNTGEKVLSSFPIQATIHFYNDDTDTEDEEDEEEQEELYRQYRDYHNSSAQDTQGSMEQETGPTAREPNFQAVDQ